MTVGNVISAGANAPPLTTLVSVSPIYASFDVGRTNLPAIPEPRRKTAARCRCNSVSRTKSGYSRSGVIESVDNRLDTSSGTIRVRARFDNQDGALMPGLYARVKVGGGEPHPALLIDDAAVGTDQDKKFVLVVDQGNHVVYRRSRRWAACRAICAWSKGGLKAGDRIVVNGIAARASERCGARAYGTDDDG